MDKNQKPSAGEDLVCHVNECTSNGRCCPFPLGVVVIGSPDDPMTKRFRFAFGERIFSLNDSKADLSHWALLVGDGL